MNNLKSLASTFFAHYMNLVQEYISTMSAIAGAFLEEVQESELRRVKENLDEAGALVVEAGGIVIGVAERMEQGDTGDRIDEAVESFGQAATEVEDYLNYELIPSAIEALPSDLSEFDKTEAALEEFYEDEEEEDESDLKKFVEVFLEPGDDVTRLEDTLVVHASDVNEARLMEDVQRHLDYDTDHVFMHESAETDRARF